MFLVSRIWVGRSRGQYRGLNVDDLRVEGRIVGIEVEAIGFNETGGNGYVVFLGGTICSDFLESLLVGRNQGHWRCLYTFVWTSGSITRMPPLCRTTTLDLSASRPTLLNDVFRGGSLGVPFCSAGESSFTNGSCFFFKLRGMLNWRWLWF